MPPPSARADRYMPDTQNTRALLRSLEELRDSLSTRVEQLAHAVERLRNQAGELERAFAESNHDLGISRMILEEEPAVPPSNIVPASRRRSASITAAHGHSTVPQDDSPAHPAPSSIQSDVSRLGNPITRAEIAALLDRASQPTFQQAQSPHGPLYFPDGVPATVGQARTRTEADARAVERISALREELRIESSRLGSWINRIPDPPTLNWDHTTRATQRDNARRARASNERIRITTIEHRRSTGPRTAQRSSNAQVEILPRQGLRPTNLRTTAPAPLVVRSLPLSPASTVTPDNILSSAFETLDESLSDSLGSESPPAARHIPLPEVLTPYSEPTGLPADESPRSIIVHTQTTETVHRPRIVSARVATPDPEEVVLSLPSDWGEPTLFDMSPSTSTAPRPRARPLSNSALTTRGRRVNARLDVDAQTRALVEQDGGGSLPLDFDESSFLSSFPTLRELFDDIATLPQETAQRPVGSAPTPDMVIDRQRWRDLRDTMGVPYIGLTLESPMDQEINAMRREEGEHLRSLAQEVVRSGPNSRRSTDERMISNAEDVRMSAGRRRMAEATRAQRQRDQADEALETPSRDQIAQVPRARYSPTAAATIATSARTDTDSTASSSTAASSSTSLQRSISRGTQVDAPLSFDQLSNRFDARTSAVRASLDRSRARMRELAGLRRDYAELQRRNAGTARGGEVDLVQVLQNGENAQEAREARAAVERARQSQGEGVYEGSGQRRDASQRRSRRQDEQGKDEVVMRGTGTAGPLKDQDLDAHLWLDTPVAQHGHRRHRPYVSMLDLEM